MPRRPRPQKVSHLDIDTKLTMKILGDLALYEYLPCLQELREPMLVLHGQIQKIMGHQKFCPGCKSKRLRGWYEDIAKKFRAILYQAQQDGVDLSPLRAFLRERKQLDATTIIIYHKDENKEMHLVTI